MWPYRRIRCCYDRQPRREGSLCLSPSHVEMEGPAGGPWRLSGSLSCFRRPEAGKEQGRRDTQGRDFRPVPCNVYLSAPSPPFVAFSLRCGVFVRVEASFVRNRKLFSLSTANLRQTQNKHIVKVKGSIVFWVSQVASYLGFGCILPVCRVRVAYTSMRT
jgi:hypothetical protein